MNAKWTDPARDEENIRWARDGFALLQPHLSSGAYANYLVQEPRERVRQAYGAETYDRLVALKDRYDPANVFRLNQNIEPSVAAPPFATFGAKNAADNEGKGLSGAKSGESPS